MNTPATTSTPASSSSIARLCLAILWLRAWFTASGNRISVRIGRPWMMLKGPKLQTMWFRNDEAATIVVSPTQIQPMVRCGKVPLGAADRTTPGPKAVNAANVCEITAVSAGRRGESVMPVLRHSKATAG